DFREAGVIEAAEALNAVFGVPNGLVAVDTPQVRVEAIKRAEDSDAVIVRLYEAWGRACTAKLTTSLPASPLWLCDLLEPERSGTSLGFDLRHFKVGPLKLAPGKTVCIKSRDRKRELGRGHVVFYTNPARWPGGEEPLSQPPRRRRPGGAPAAEPPRP